MKVHCSGLSALLVPLLLASARSCTFRNQRSYAVLTQHECIASPYKSHGKAHQRRLDRSLVATFFFHKTLLDHLLVYSMSTSTIRKSARLNAGATKHTVQVVSYNVLSSHLSEASHFVHCRPEDCEPATRYAAVMKKVSWNIFN